LSHVSDYPEDNFSIHMQYVHIQCTYAMEILLTESFSIGVGLLTISQDEGWRQVISKDVHM